MQFREVNQLMKNIQVLRTELEQKIDKEMFVPESTAQFSIGAMDLDNEEEQQQQ